MKNRYAPLLFLLLLGLPSLLRAQTLEDSSLRVDLVTSGLNSPTTMAFIGPDDILVLQKNDGRVRRVIGGVLQSGQVLDVNVHNSSERGLLGIALHPQFPSTPFVYLYYTESSTGSDTSGASTPLGNRVYRYTWNGNALVNRALILDLPATPGPNHDGGIITFGPDGKLYVVIGDLNRAGKLQNFPSGPAPDNTSVILRLNDDGSTPTDNPFVSQGGNLAKYYAYGVRNAFGMAFDPVTEKLWMTENGPNTYDELNLSNPALIAAGRRLWGPTAVTRRARLTSLLSPARITATRNFPGSIPSRQPRWLFLTQPAWDSSMKMICLLATLTTERFIGFNQTRHGPVLLSKAPGSPIASQITLRSSTRLFWAQALAELPTLK